MGFNRLCVVLFQFEAETGNFNGESTNTDWLQGSHN
jgi:hypothetical protein